MQFSVEDIQGVKILRLHEKRLDTTIAPHLKAELILLMSKEPYNLLIDLKNVDYADSSGLGALLLGLRQARDKDGALALLNIQKRVKDLIHIARLDDVLQTFDNEQDAFNYFNNQIS